MSIGDCVRVVCPHIRQCIVIAQGPRKAELILFEFALYQEVLEYRLEVGSRTFVRKF